MPSDCPPDFGRQEFSKRSEARGVEGRKSGRRERPVSFYGEAVPWIRDQDVDRRSVTERDLGGHAEQNPKGLERQQQHPEPEQRQRDDRHYTVGRQPGRKTDAKKL